LKSEFKYELDMDCSFTPDNKISVFKKS
jgi:hypothetical protein